MKKARKLLASLLVLVMILCMLPATVVASSEQSHKDLAREVVDEGIVMLKNKDNALPLSSKSKVALFGGGQRYVGSTSNGYQIGGGGSGWVNMDYTPNGPSTVLAGLVDVYEPLKAAYDANVSYVPTDAMYEAAAEYADTAIMFITRFSTEGSDINAANWYLSDAEKTMLQKLSDLFEDVVVLINAPSMMSTDWSLDDNEYGIDVDALLITYMGGEMGAYGMADVLTGAVSPSGKLADTYALDLYDYASTETFLESNSYTRYTDDIYVGYRYFETFGVDVAYEFGFGMSYTTFDITTNSVTNDGNNIIVNVTVTNTGDVAGKEVVQVYYSAPQVGEEGVAIPKAAIELAAYEKTDLLAPGASQTMDISYAINAMASFDDTGMTGNMSCNVLEAGVYDIIVGNSVKNNEVAGNYVVAADTVTETLSQLCATTLDERMVAAVNENGEIVQEMADLSSNTATLVTKDAVTIIEGESYNNVYGSATPMVESFTANQGWIYNGSTWVKTGAGQVLGDLDNTVEQDMGFKVSVRDAGTYRMSFVASNGRQNGSNVEDIMTVYLLDAEGNKTETGIHYDLTNTYSAHEVTNAQWWNFMYVTEDFDGNAYTLELPAGDYEIVLSLNPAVNGNGNMNFDKFYIIPEGLDYTLQDAIDAYGYVEPEYQGLDLDADAYVGIKYADVVSGEATMDEFLAQMSLNEMIDLCSGHTAGITTGTGSIGPSSDATAIKYGVYAADTADGGAGLRLSTYFATYLPCFTLQACTWNKELLTELGAMVGDEAIDSMADIWLAPGLNIHRSPLCGRNFEYFSEDPVLTGKSAGAVIHGVQSKGVQVDFKHFCTNNKETNRSNIDSRVSERALREIYIKAFQIVVMEENPAFIMTSYNYLNGIETAENPELLMGIVRGEWGWEGAFTTDWGNNSNFVNEINAGNNVKMATGDLTLIQDAVQYGLITREKLEENTMYLLNAIAKCPDYTINQYKVHELSIEGSTFIHSTDYSRKSYHSRYEKVSALNELCTTYAESTDADGHRLFLEFTVDAPTAGTYHLDLNYANGSSSRANAFEIYVNGELVNGLNTTVPGSGGWTTYTTMNIGKITLPAGESVIKLQHIQENGVNYRGITLTLNNTLNIGNGEGAYGDTVRIKVTSNVDNLTTVRGTFDCAAKLVDVQPAKGGYVVFNEETGEAIAFKMDGDVFSRGEVVFYAYFEIDKLAVDGVDGDVPVYFIADDATLSETTIDICKSGTGYITITTEYAAGDVNGDGIVNNVDVIMVARHIVHIAELTDAQIERADIDNSNSITNADLVKLARMVVEG